MDKVFNVLYVQEVLTWWTRFFNVLYVQEVLTLWINFLMYCISKKSWPKTSWTYIYLRLYNIYYRSRKCKRKCVLRRMSIWQHTVKAHLQGHILPPLPLRLFFHYLYQILPLMYLGEGDIQFLNVSLLSSLFYFSNPFFLGLIM